MFRIFVLFFALFMTPQMAWADPGDGWADPDDDSDELDLETETEEEKKAREDKVFNIQKNYDVNKRSKRTKPKPFKLSKSNATMSK